MTRTQNMIVNYINQQFVPGSVTIIPVGESHVKITDKNKESLTFTVNIFGDIIDADTNKIIAEASLEQGHQYSRKRTVCHAGYFTN